MSGCNTAWQYANQMEPLTLENIARVCGGTYVGEPERLGACITGVTTDSRSIAPGGLFVAIQGARADGHDFIPEVLEKGALAALCEREPGVPAGYIRVASTTEALKTLAAFYRGSLSIPIVGVVGSVGKTSTKEMIASILGQKYRVLKTEGNYNNEIGLPLTIFRIQQEHEAAVLEMGISDFGEMHRLAAMAQPDICVMTNIGDCHLEQLKDRDGVLAAKTEVFSHMPPEGTVILNGDDDKLCTQAIVNGKPSVFYGLGAEAKRSEDGTLMAEKSIYATDIEHLGMEGLRARIHTPQGEFLAELPLPGGHNLYNALAGTAVGLALGLSLEEIARGIASVQTIEGRFRRLERGSVTIIDDCYNANPASMRASLGVLAHAGGRKIAVLGDMGELGADARRLHRDVGRAVAENGIDVLFAAGELAKEYAKAAEHACEVHVYPGVDALLPELCAFVRGGDVVLVKASHFMNFPRVVAALDEME